MLADISNGALRELVDKMAAAELSAKSIVSHAAVVKMVLASAVNADGDQLYPRTWNAEFVGLPIVRKDEQHRPTITETEVSEILAGTKGATALCSHCWRVLVYGSVKRWQSKIQAFRQIAEY